MAVDVQLVERLVGAFNRAYVAQTDADSLLNLIRDESPNAETLGVAAARCAAGWGRAYQWVGAVFETAIQVRLTAEHVAAQKEMSAAADELAKASHRLAGNAFWLNWASLAVAIAALVVAVLTGSS